MKIFYFMFVLLISWPAQADELKLATFNAEFLTRPKLHVKFGLPFTLTDPNDIEQWSDPNFVDEKFAEAAAAVAGVLARIDADVLVLNEVGDQIDVTELVAAIQADGVSYTHLAVCNCTDTFTAQHVAILSKLPFTDVVGSIAGREGFFAEADDDDSEEDTGISKGMIVKFVFDGHPITLYGVHFASERGGSEKDEQRIAQASIVRRHTVRTILDHPDEMFIVAGDLNDGRGQPALRRIRGIDDIWPDLIQTGDARYFEDSKLGTRWTYEYMGTRNQIDHVLLSPSFRNVLTNRAIRPEVPEQDNPLASDHRPFVVTLDFQ